MNPGPFKADLFRYVALYLKGGVWLYDRLVYLIGDIGLNNTFEQKWSAESKCQTLVHGGILRRMTQRERGWGSLRHSALTEREWLDFNRRHTHPSPFGRVINKA